MFYSENNLVVNIIPILVKERREIDESNTEACVLNCI
jgi:hypothetical protein